MMPLSGTSQRRVHLSRALVVYNITHVRLFF
jgi:ABC-type phosphate/phosphonate transport system ATPase subunit